MGWSMLAPNDADEAWTIIDRLEAYYRAMFDGIAEDDAIYEGLLDEFFDPPPGFELTIPTTGRAIVDEAVDNAAPSDFLIRYSPRDKTQKGRDDADAVRLFCKYLIAYWRRNGQDIDPIRDFMKNLFKSGMAAFKVAPDFSLWPQLSEDSKKEIEIAYPKGQRRNEEFKKRVDWIKRVRAENTPIALTSLPPNCIMQDPTMSGRKAYIVERHQTSPAEIQANYAVDSSLFRDGYDVSYPVHECWTASRISYDGKFYGGKHWVFVNWESVRDEDNLYDDLPYIVKFAGYGREAYEGRPEYKAVGFYTRQLKSMLLAEMRRFTHLDAIMSQIAFPIVFLDQAAEMSGVEFLPGKVNFVPTRVLENVQNMWVVPKIPTADYANNMGAIGAQIERGSVQRALRGGSMPGVDSAQHFGAVNAQAKLRIESVVQATEQALSLACSMALRYIDQILEESVSVITADDRTSRLSIGPQQIKGHYVVDVRFQPNEEAILERKILIVNDAITKLGLAPYDAYELAGFEDPGEMVQSRLAAKAMDDPIMVHALAKEALAAWGLDADKIEMEVRIGDFQKQKALSDIINALSLGTGAGMGGAGAPPAQPGMLGLPPGGASPQQGAPAGILPGGAPPAAIQDPNVAATAGAIGGLNSGLSPA